MAQRAETLNMEIEAEEPVRRRATDSPLRVPREETVTNIRRAAGSAYEQAMSWAVESYARVAEKSEIIAARVGRNFRILREERPLVILGLAAGTAFALGVVLRVWRSRYDA